MWRVLVPLVLVAGCHLVIGHSGQSADAQPDGGTVDSRLDTEPYAMGVPASAPLRWLALDAGSELVLRWEPIPGRPAELDLVVAAGERELFQVFASRDRPFARAGLKVVPLVPRELYRVRLPRVGAGVRVSLARVGSGWRLLDQDLPLEGNPGFRLLLGLADRTPRVLVHRVDPPILANLGPPIGSVHR